MEKETGQTICGVDPGLASTGYGILEVMPGKVKLVEAGVIKTSGKYPLEKRISEIYTALRELFAEQHPDMVVVEDLFTDYKNPKTAVLMGHARGVCLLAAAQAGAGVASFAPSRIKKSLTGIGSASKIQVQKAVQSRLGLVEMPSPDHMADAIAMALCFHDLQNNPLTAAMKSPVHGLR